MPLKKSTRSLKKKGTGAPKPKRKGKRLADNGFDLSKEEKRTGKLILNKKEQKEYDKLVGAITPDEAKDYKKNRDEHLARHAPKAESKTDSDASKRLLLIHHH